MLHEHEKETPLELLQKLSSLELQIAVLLTTPQMRIRVAPLCSFLKILWSCAKRRFDRPVINIGERVDHS